MKVLEYCEKIYFCFQCKILLPTNSTSCNIPCVTTGCKIEVHHDMNCPIWICEPNPDPTTTMSPSSSSEPTPDPPQPDHSTSFSVSIFFNILFGLVLLAVLASYGFRRFKKTRQNYNRIEMRTFGESDPTQSRENEPLLVARENEPSLTNRENEPSLANRENEPSLVANSSIENPAALIEISLDDNANNPSTNETRSSFSRFRKFFKK